MDKKNKKGALEFSFTWIFSIVVGGFILFITIFGIIKYINIETSSQDVQTAKEISVFLNPLESSFETGGKTTIKTSIETRIYSGCGSGGLFGKQTIKTSQLINNKWSETNREITSQNRYVFSKNYAEGKKFYVYSKPFEFPFKIADLIYLTSSEDKYCFTDAPEKVEDELSSWNGENLIFKNDDEDCPEDSINVCFGSGAGKCNVIVDERGRSVKKGEKIVFFEDYALMYAAIFSDRENYECQINRLMKRVELLSLIYKDKSTFLSQGTGCSPELISDLIIFSNSAKSIANSDGLSALASLAKEIQDKNEYAECRLW